MFQPQPILADLLKTGTLTSLTSSVILECNGISEAKVVVSGTWVGTVKFQQSIDNTRWDNIDAFSGTSGNALISSQITSNDFIILSGISGVAKIRVIFTAYTSGTATIVLRASIATSHVLVENLIPANLNNTSRTNDGVGNAITSQANGSQRPLDVGVNVSGVQVDPRAIRALTSADVVSAAQSGVWTVQPGNTQNTTAWLTQDSSDGPVTPGTAASKSSLSGGQYNSTLPTLSNAQQSALQLDVNGKLLVQWGVADKTSFTYGTSIQQPIGGVYQDSAPTLTAGQEGAVRLTQYRALHTSLRDTAGTAITSTTDGSNLKLNVNTPDSTSSGSITDGNSISFTCDGLNSVIIEIGGVWTDNGGTGKLLFESTQGTQFWSVQALEVSSTFVTAPNVVPSINTNHSGIYLIPCSGFYQVRVRALGITGTPTINFRSSAVGSQYNYSANYSPFDINTSDSLSSFNDTVLLNTHGVAGAEFLLSGSWVGTVVAEGSLDGFQNISNLSIVQTTGVITTSGVTSNGNYRILVVSNFTQIRLRMSAYTSGTANAIVNASQVTSTQYVWQLNPANLNAQVVGNVASGATDSGNPVKIGGTYNSSLPTLSSGQRGDAQVDSNGRLLAVSIPIDGTKDTFSACALAFTAANSATDIFTITGSASKTIRVTKIEITASQTTAGSNNVVVLKRSTANSAGTSTTLTNVKHDSNNASATATVRSYTANPTTGTLVGNIRVDKMQIATALLTSQVITHDFGNRPSQSIVLRGTGEVLAINLNATTITGNNFNIFIEWTEE